MKDKGVARSGVSHQALHLVDHVGCRHMHTGSARARGLSAQLDTPAGSAPRVGHSCWLGASSVSMMMSCISSHFHGLHTCVQQALGAKQLSSRRGPCLGAEAELGGQQILDAVRIVDTAVEGILAAPAAAGHVSSTAEGVGAGFCQLDLHKGPVPAALLETVRMGRCAQRSGLPLTQARACTVGQGRTCSCSRR